MTKQEQQWYKKIYSITRKTWLAEAYRLDNILESNVSDSLNSALRLEPDIKDAYCSVNAYSLNRTYDDSRIENLAYQSTATVYTTDSNVISFRYDSVDGTETRYICIEPMADYELHEELDNATYESRRNAEEAKDAIADIDSVEKVLTLKVDCDNEQSDDDFDDLDAYIASINKKYIIDFTAQLKDGSQIMYSYDSTSGRRSTLKVCRPEIITKTNEDRYNNGNTMVYVSYAAIKVGSRYYVGSKQTVYELDGYNSGNIIEQDNNYVYDANNDKLMLVEYLSEADENGIATVTSREIMPNRLIGTISDDISYTCPVPVSDERLAAAYVLAEYSPEYADDYRHLKEEYKKDYYAMLEQI